MAFKIYKIEATIRYLVYVIKGLGWIRHMLPKYTPKLAQKWRFYILNLKQTVFQWAVFCQKKQLYNISNSNTIYLFGSFSILELN